MIRDITIGQYYPAKSVLHRLDPRTKFLGTLGFLISVFLFHTFLGYAVATAFLVAMIAISKVPVKFMFKGLKAIVMILLITVVFNIILTLAKCCGVSGSSRSQGKALFLQEEWRSVLFTL